MCIEKFVLMNITKELILIPVLWPASWLSGVESRANDVFLEICFYSDVYNSTSALAAATLNPNVARRCKSVDLYIYRQTFLREWADPCQQFINWCVITEPSESQEAYTEKSSSALKLLVRNHNGLVRCLGVLGLIRLMQQRRKRSAYW